MTQDAPSLAPPDPKPLNPRQKVFARELGLAIAKGGRDDDLIDAYTAAGYAPDRGNALKSGVPWDKPAHTVNRNCASGLEALLTAWQIIREGRARVMLAGLHIGYLQAKALELLHANPMRIHRNLAKFMTAEVYGEDPNTVVRLQMRADLTPDEEAALDSVTWPLSKFKIDKDGVISIELPDKKGIIEMLAKQLGVGKDDAGDVNVNVGLEALVMQSLTQPQKENV